MAFIEFSEKSVGKRMEIITMAFKYYRIKINPFAYGNYDKYQLINDFQKDMNVS